MSAWISVIIAIAGMLASGGVAYGMAVGIAKARINGMAERVSRLESTNFITRAEYESRHKELRETTTSNHQQLMEMIRTMLASAKM